MSFFDRNAWAGSRFSGPRPLLAVLFGLIPSLLLCDYQSGLDAYNAGDYAGALADWKAEVAGEPDPNPQRLVVYREALYGIALLYWKGEGVSQDYGIATVWLKQAADINHTGAQNKLGYLYATGQGVPQNLNEAMRYFRMAASQASGRFKAAVSK